MDKPNSRELAPEEITPKLERLIAKVEHELASGGVSRPFDNVDDLIADLKRPS